MQARVGRVLTPELVLGSVSFWQGSESPLAVELWIVPVYIQIDGLHSQEAYYSEDDRTWITDGRDKDTSTQVRSLWQRRPVRKAEHRTSSSPVAEEEEWYNEDGCVRGLFQLPIAA